MRGNVANEIPQAILHTPLTQMIKGRGPENDHTTQSQVPDWLHDFRSTSPVF